MAHGRARDERKERQWRSWIGEWQASGLTVRTSNLPVGCNKSY